MFGLLIVILGIVYIIDPFPEFPSKASIKSYPVYFNQKLSGLIDSSLTYRGRCYITLKTGQKLRLPWAKNTKSDLGIWEYLEIGDSIQIRSDTIYLIKDQSELIFRIIE